jgi:quercetin dioxygenase-like cupin family protein
MIIKSFPISFALWVLYSSCSLAQAEPQPQEMINDTTPPCTVVKASEALLLHQTHPSGNDIVIMKTIRPGGTRTPIHQHPSSGSTCVISGEMTLYLEGAAPQRAPAGTCYAMPAGKKMAGVNSGKEEAVMIDIFVTPKGGELWTVVEPQHQKLQNQLTPPTLPVAPVSPSHH